MPDPRYGVSGRSQRPWRTVMVGSLAGLVAIIFLLGILVTSGSPWVTARPVPTAEQVGAGRDAVLQLRSGRMDPAGLSHLHLGEAQLDGFAALASHGFRPDRMEFGLQGGTLRFAGSHRLWGGRWLNVVIAASGTNVGLPPVDMTIGSLRFGPRLSRAIFQVARLALILRGVKLPRLDAMVQEVDIGPNLVTATLFLPRKSGLVDEMAGVTTTPINEAIVAEIYCRVADAQRSRPSDDFAEQMRRAFEARGAGSAVAFNRAAFIALAMILVDDQVGDLAGRARKLTDACRIAPVIVTVHGRADLPKHWILSAAFGVSAGTQFAQAIGEWKELADSLSRQSSFAVGDPSGFSFVDISADRAGFRTAEAAVDPGSADRIAAKLAQATPQALLPIILLQRPDSLTNAEFVRHFGGIADPRYLAAIRRIDEVMDQDGIR